MSDYSYIGEALRRGVTIETFMNGVKLIYSSLNKIEEDCQAMKQELQANPFDQEIVTKSKTK